MDLRTAAQIDAMLIVARNNLAEVSNYILENVEDETERKLLISYIGKGLGETLEIHNIIYSQYPDLKPADMRPEQI